MASSSRFLYKDFVNISLISHTFYKTRLFNPLNPKLNPICYLLALLGAQHILHVSGIGVNGAK